MGFQGSQRARGTKMTAKIAAVCLLAFIAIVQADKAMVTQKVFFDVKMGNGPTERIVFGLFGETVPKTARNFYELCTHKVITISDPARFCGTRIVSPHNVPVA